MKKIFSSVNGLVKLLFDGIQCSPDTGRSRKAEQPIVGKRCNSLRLLQIRCFILLSFLGRELAPWTRDPLSPSSDVGLIQSESNVQIHLASPTDTSPRQEKHNF